MGFSKWDFEREMEQGMASQFLQQAKLDQKQGKKKKKKDADWQKDIRKMKSKGKTKNAVTGTAKQGTGELADYISKTLRYVAAEFGDEASRVSGGILNGENLRSAADFFSGKNRSKEQGENERIPATEDLEASAEELQEQIVAAAQKAADPKDSRRLRQTLPVHKVLEKEVSSELRDWKESCSDAAKLQEAVLWSEILGEPVAKRRQRARRRAGVPVGISHSGFRRSM